MTYDPDKHDGLVIAPENDGFSHETPLRAFTDWQDVGFYAIGRGFRPAVQHLASYLDAIERKEGWQLGQLFAAPDGRPSAAWFRRVPQNPYPAMAEAAEQSRGNVETIDFHGCATMGDAYQAVADGLGIDRATILRDSYRANYTRPARMWGDPEVERRHAGLPSIGEVGEPFEPVKDDPINPRHYGGTACAEIGERLTANCYQVLKYCWRLGEKDDPVQELGKAIWYAAREKLLGPARSRGSAPLPGMKQDFVLERTADNPWRREIAMMLWEMCYGFGTPPHWHCAADELIRVLQEKKREMTPRGRGMEP
jgi:hypothetical protein